MPGHGLFESVLLQDLLVLLDLTHNYPYTLPDAARRSVCGAVDEVLLALG
jgi:hypothetical protein